jgi:tetratricopeptide (TPR) repeat protein
VVKSVPPGSRLFWLASLVLWTVAGGCGSPDVDREGQLTVPGPDLTHLGDQRLKGAIEAAQATVAQRASAESWGHLGHLYFIHGWPSEATDCYQRAVDLEPDQFRWQYFHGRALSETDLAGAAAAFERAIGIDAGYIPAYVHGARILTDMGQLDAAVGYLERARTLDPDNPFVELGLAQHALAAGEFESARPHLQRALELDADLGEAHAALAQVYMAQGDREGARGHADLSARERQGRMMTDPLLAAVQQLGISRFWLHTRGKSRLQAGDFAGALTQFSLLVDDVDQEGDPMVWCGYGGALLGLGRHDEALVALERALSEAERQEGDSPLSPENVRLIHTNLGHAYAVTARQQMATSHLREALRLDPVSVSAAFNLALVYFRADSLEQARDVLESIADLRGHQQAAKLLRTVRERTAAVEP